MNSSYERACTHTRICALVHMYVGDRRRLKRSPTSIALAINALSASASSFCLSPRNARFRIIDVNPFTPSPRPSFLIIPRVDVTFLTSQRECFLRAAIPDLSNLDLSNSRDSNFQFATALLDLSIFRAVFRKYCEIIIRKRCKSLNNKLCEHKEILIVNRVCRRGSQQSAAISLASF